MDQTLVLIAAGAALAGFAQGVSGFAFALVALSVWAWGVDPRLAVVLSVFGSLVGAVLLTALPQALASFEGWETVAYGAILMLCMIFLPRGLVPTLAGRWRRGH